MRAMWKGSIAFGLVNVPVKLYAATEDHDVRFHQVHAADGGRVTMVRTCSIDGEKLEYEDLAKAYESESGQVVVMQDEDLEDLPVPGVREVEVVEFVPVDQVDPVLFDRSYYLEPEPRALKPYVLLREALARTERMALVRVVLRHKTQLAALRVRGDVLVMQTMLWPDEVRAADFDVLESDVDLRPQELSMAASLIDSLSSDFVAEDFHDDYREALLAVIDRKFSGGGTVAADRIEAGDDSGEGIVLDLMAALRESVDAHQGAQAMSREAEAEPKRKRTAARAAKRGVSVTTPTTAARHEKTSDAPAGTSKEPSANKRTAATTRRTKSAAKKAEPTTRRRTA